MSLREAGKVRFIGMSGTLPHLPEHIAMGVFDVFQIPYSALQREHEDLISAAAAVGAGTLIRGGAARGAPAQDKDWRHGPLGLADGEGKHRWQCSGVQELLGDMTRYGVRAALHAEPPGAVQHRRRHLPDQPSPL